MGAPGDIYERELKFLLSGDSKIINKMVKTCDETEESGYRRMEDQPFVVIRAAGSLGVDLVASRARAHPTERCISAGTRDSPNKRPI